MGPPHEVSIRRPIEPWVNALTTKLGCQINEYVLSVFNESRVPTVCVVAAGAGRRGGGQQRCPAGGRQQPELWDEPAQPAGQTVDGPHGRRVPRVGVDALTGGQRLGHTGQNHGSTQTTFIVNDSKQQVEHASDGYIVKNNSRLKSYIVRTLDKKGYIVNNSRPKGYIVKNSRPKGYIVNNSRPKGYIIKNLRPEGYIVNYSRPKGYIVKISRPKGYIVKISRPKGYIVEISRPKGYIVKNSRPEGYII